MPTAFGSVRRLVLTPSLAKVSFSGRGFPAPATPSAQRLELIPHSVICGFEWGIDARNQWEVERRLAMVDAEFRGFAYEGVTMAFTVLDAMGSGHRTRDLLMASGEPHIFLCYIGVGFAMARLPRPLWRKVLPDLEGSPYHPTMSWLAVDGYGFDRAYFDTGRVVDRQRELAPYPWAGAPGYFPRAVDQGIGRALWFIHGGEAEAVAAAVDRFPERRRADLWSGVGLAATFAGGCAPEDLLLLRKRAGALAPELALGAVFAVKARHYAGFVPEHTAAAVSGLTALDVNGAVALADDTAVDPAATGPQPPYELWRSRIRGHFTGAFS